MSDERYTSPGNGGDGQVARISRNEAGQLTVWLRGKDDPVIDARVIRCFPWSTPDSYLSIHNADGKEAAMLKSLDDLDGASREVVEEELRDKVFNPKILRILDFKEEFSITSVTAETDRGKVTFQIRNRDDVRVLTASRALFRDVDGNTYELADIALLDRRARRHLEKYF